MSLHVATLMLRRRHSSDNLYDRGVWLHWQPCPPNLTHGIALVSGAHRCH
ncbi:hypothetical protein [Synechococcus sp. MIT S1220]